MKDEIAAVWLGEIAAEWAQVAWGEIALVNGEEKNMGAFAHPFAGVMG